MVPFFDVEAVPKRILELMNVDKLTRENVASHLQVIFCAQNNPLSFKKINKRKEERKTKIKEKDQIIFSRETTTNDFSFTYQTIYCNIFHEQQQLFKYWCLSYFVTAKK